MNPSPRPPLLLSIARQMIRLHIRGAGLLIGFMLPHWKNRTVDYRLTPELQFTVPIGRRETCLDARDVQEFERHHIESFCSAIRDSEHLTLFDCGADIGLFSASVCARMSNVHRVIAFEPNQEFFQVLALNISRLPSGEAHDCAVSDFSGFGKLVRPDYDESAHARYMVQADSGFAVTTIDHFGSKGDVAIKIDVEGGELAVIRGALDTIRSARRATITFEAHPLVIGRTHIYPRECMLFLESIRPFMFKVAETGEVVASESLQLPGGMVNIIAQSI